MRTQASLLSTAALTAQVAVLKKDYERSEQELGTAMRQLEEKEGKIPLNNKICPWGGLISKNNRIELPFVGVTKEVETLRQALAEAEKKAAEECTKREKLGGQYGEVEQKLQALMEKHEGLELDVKAQATELASAIEATKNAKGEAQRALQELEDMRKIAAGKTFSMQSRNIKVKYLLLTRVRSSPGVFFDLPRSASNAAAFFLSEGNNSTESVFWSQYSEAGHPVPLSDQLKQLAELHKAAEQAMKDLLVRLWPGEALPRSYFGLVRRLVEACPRLEVIKRSACIEGARRALARVRVHWGKLDGEKLVKDGPPPGKEHHKPENYYKDVLAGARLLVDECTKDVIFN